MRILMEESFPRYRTILEGYGNAFRASGHESTIWSKEKPAYDIFAETSPHIYIKSTGDLTRAETKCIAKMGNSLKVVPHTEILPAFDTILFSRLGSFHEELACDVCFVGDYRPEKQELLNKYIGPLLSKYKVKLFGRSPWTVANYIGYIDNEMLPDLYASAKVCLNVSSNRISERAYQICGLGGTCVSNMSFDYTLKSNTHSFWEFVGVNIKHPTNNSRIGAGEFVDNGNSYFHRVATLLSSINFTREAERVMTVYESIM